MEVVNSAGGKHSDSDPDSSTRIQILNPGSCSNGVLNRTNHVVVGGGRNGGVVYKECLKNHAASIGAHAVDGCGEFMPSPASNPADPTSLTCAACGCHRNFHRQVTEEEEEEEDNLPASNTRTTIPALEYLPHHRHHPPPTPPPPPPGDGGASTPSSASPPPISSSYYPSAAAPHLLLTLSGGSTPLVIGNRTVPVAGNGGRKRFRTRFTHNQKEKMLGFAEKLGWKMQKKDEDLIAHFCNEIAVEKGVFKVWMHNNKNIFGRKEHSNSLPATTTTTTIGIHPNSTTTTTTVAAFPAAVTNNNGNGSISFLHHHLLQNHGGQNEINLSNNNNHNNHHFHGDSFDDGRVAGPNGSSSSS